MKKVEGGRCRPQIALNRLEISSCVCWPAAGVEQYEALRVASGDGIFTYWLLMT